MRYFVLALLLLLPFRVLADEPTPTETPTPTVTETPTPTVTETPTPQPTSEPTATPTQTPQSLTSYQANTPTPTLKKTPTPSKAASSTSGFGGAGLVDDPPDTGLSSGAGSTLGETTELKTNDAGDADLLKTLIFLTGAVVLIVWSTYVVLVQKGVIASGKKKKQSQSGITPQSIE